MAKVFLKVDGVALRRPAWNTTCSNASVLKKLAELNSNLK